ncbi:MAG: methionine adenosyltransferase [Candidatus Aenigmarchaeota archaeon]|nr:methionine adenosyltransferase [Candidatus Aenigmarchaeota archaeon]
MPVERLFTSESVTEGHPDKVCDRISDAVLDAVFDQDPEARVACEVFAPGGSSIIVGGELTTSAYVDLQKIVAEALCDIGYDKPEYGLDYRTISISNLIKEQSPDIAQGVTGDGMYQEKGAGDQGIMFGFAIAGEGDEYMPLPISMAHQLARQLAQVRKAGIIPYLRPDGKTQVTVEYNEQGKPIGIHTVVVAAQHDDGIEHGQIVEDIKREVILPVAGGLVNRATKYFINATGKFVIGGPAGDTGLTGRKIIVDTYGGGTHKRTAGHGGGAFSGKDPTKVDRSGAYMLRKIAKSVVAAGFAQECEIQVSYVIGRADPLSLAVNTYGTGVMTDEDLAGIIREEFDLQPEGIIKGLDLRRPIYAPTAAYGHFGRPEFPWEGLDKVKDLQRHM